MTMFLRWWLLFCTSLGAAYTAHIFGFTQALLDNDQTRISFGIIVVYLVMSVLVGYATYLRNQGEIVKIYTNIGWFASEMLLALGMIGTVIGFILMLGSSFEGINVADTGSVKDALQNMAMGMSTALYTTLVGLVCSQLLKVQLVNVESR